MATLEEFLEAEPDVDEDVLERIRERTEKALAKMYPDREVRVELASFDRDIKEQVEHFKSGASQTPLSLHNFGKAGDYAIYIDGERVTADGSPGIKGSLEPYQVLGHYAKEEDLFWGWPWDSGHVGETRFVNEFLKKNPEAIDHPEVQEAYNWMLQQDTLPKGLRGIAETIGEHTGKRFEGEFVGDEPTESQLLEPIDPSEFLGEDAETEPEEVEEPTGQGERMAFQMSAPRLEPEEARQDATIQRGPFEIKTPTKPSVPTQEPQDEIIEPTIDFDLGPLEVGSPMAQGVQRPPIQQPQDNIIDADIDTTSESLDAQPIEQPQPEPSNIDSFLQAEPDQNISSFLEAEPEPTRQDTGITDTQKFALDLMSLHHGGFGEAGPQTRFFSSVNAFVQGVGTLGEGFLKGVAAINKNIATNLAEAAKTAKEGTIKKEITDPIPVEDYKLFKAGEKIGNLLEETFPENPEYQGEFFASTLPRGFGTFAGQAATAVATGGLASAAITSVGFSGLEYDEALKATGDEDKAFQTMLLNMPVMAMEQLPVLAGMSKLNRGTGGGFNKVLKRAAQTRTGVGVMEGIQEVTQEYSTNLIAQNMYDESRDLIAGLDQAGAAGFIIGFTARSLGVNFRQRAKDPSVTPQERAEAIVSLEHLNEQTSRMVREGKIDQEVRPVTFEFAQMEEGHNDFRLEVNDPMVVDEKGNPIGFGYILGEVETDIEGKPTEYRIATTHLRGGLRGKGVGSQMYMRLLHQAKQDGANVESDFKVSSEAKRVYESLIRRGFPVKVAEDATVNEDGSIQSNSDEAVYTIDTSKIDDKSFPADITDPTFRGRKNILEPKVSPGREVDERPTFYHGTTAEFDSFNERHLGKKTEADDTALGFHFTDNREVASKLFAGEEGTVKEVKLNIDKPLVINDFLGDPTDKQVGDLTYILTGKEGGPGTDAFDQTKRILQDPLAFNHGGFKQELSRDAEGVRKRMKELGYDAIKLPLTSADVLGAANRGVENTSGTETIVIDASKIEVSSEPQLRQSGQGTGARVGRSRPRTFDRQRDIFNPDAVPTAEEFLGAPSRKEFNSEEQSSFDVTESQSSIISEQQPKTSWQRLKRSLKHWLAPSGKYPSEMFRDIFEVGDINREVKQMAFIMRDTKQALKKEFDIGPAEEAFYSDKVPKQTYNDMRAVLRGDRSVDTLPERLRAPVRAMRNHIDTLSRQLLKSGIAEGPLDVVIRENIGLYIHRTYKVHTQPEWADSVPKDIKRRAFTFIKQEYKKAGQNLSDNQVNNIINTLLYDRDNSPIKAIRQGKVKSMDLSPLKKRKDIPEPIRELLGEETNPVVNYVNSVNAIANLIQQHKTLTRLRDKYEGIYFYKQDAENIPKEAWATIAAEGSDSMAPLAGMKTTPEIKEAFEEVANNWKEQSMTFRWYMNLNAAAKFSKTVLNPSTISRNVLGGSFFLMASGHNPLGGNFHKGWEAAKSAFVNPDTEAGRQRILRYAELNMLGSSPQAGEINDLIGDISQAENYQQLQSFLMGKGLKSKAVRGVKKASDFYQAGDTLMRVIFFEAELARLKDAVGDTMTEKELEQEAARITNELYQNYDLVPKAIKKARKLPVAPFIAFQYEVVRTTTNLYKRIKSELDHDNPEMRKIGYKRLAGASFAGGMMLAASIASKALLGIGEEEEEDIRRFAAPWDANSTLTFLDSDRGYAKFINGSYIDPYEYLKDPVIGLLTGRGEDEVLAATIEAAGKLLEPITQSEIFVKQLWEAINNRKDTGGEVYNPQDDLSVKMAKSVAHLWGAFRPGFLRNSANIYEALEDNNSDREVPVEVLALFGLRVTKVDFEKGLAFKARDYAQAKRDDKRIYNKAKFDEDVDALGEQQARQEANQKYQQHFNEMARDIEAAMRKGVRWRNIRKQLEDNGISKSEIERLRNGRFERFSR